MNNDDEAKALASAAKGFSKAQRERGRLAGTCYARAKAGDKGWGDLLHAGEETLVSLLAMQAFSAGYLLACQHLARVGSATGNFADVAAKTRGTYTARELNAMNRGTP